MPRVKAPDFNLKILSKDENSIEILIEKETHTLLNLLTKRLVKKPEVEVAYYDIPHPLKSEAILYVRVKKGCGVKPEEVLMQVVDEVLEEIRRAREEFSKAISQQ